MKTLKAMLLKFLGHTAYLQLTSKAFFIAFKNGWLKNNPAYYTHYLVKEMIAPGSQIIDIGANLGYYSCLFAEKTGANGHVYSVEPIDLYRNILKKNTAVYPQVTLMPYALGSESGTLKMGNPSPDKHRHGLMRVLGPDEIKDAQYEVEVKNPLDLFASLRSIDYIKCDIEGYEVPVIPAMKTLLEKHRPLVQVETEGDNKIKLMELFKELHYQTYFATNNGLVAYTHPTETLPADLMAIPKEKVENYRQWISNER
jgi:FkbM family methyltransferase